MSDYVESNEELGKKGKMRRKRMSFCLGDQTRSLKEGEAYA